MDRDVFRRALVVGLAGAAILATAAPAAAEDEGPDTLAQCTASPDPPIGASFQAFDGDNRVVVAGQPVDQTGGAGKINLVALDRTNRHVDLAQAFDNDPAGATALAAAIHDGQTADSGHLYVVSAANGIQAGAADPLVRALEAIGATVSKASRATLAAGRPFAAVGVPKAPPQSAWIDVDGNVSGYLQVLTATCQYGFVPGEYPQVDTDVPPDVDGQHRMRVGPNLVAHALPDDGRKPGFHVVVVDSKTLDVEFNEAYAVNTGDLQEDRHAQQQFHFLLAHTRPHDLVLVQSYGAPKPTTPVWGDIAKEIARLGGTATVFNELDGTGDYAFIGGEPEQGWPNASVEVSKPLNHEAGQLQGALMRQRNYDYTPLVTSDTVNLNLANVAYQPAQPYPAFTPAQQLAAAYVAEQIGFDAGTDLRRKYWERWDLDWNGKRADIDKVPYPADPAEFGPDDLAAVKTEFDKEISALVQVKGFIANVQRPFTEALPEYVDLQDIAKDVIKAVKPPEEEKKFGTLQILTTIFGFASKALPRPGSQVVGLVGQVFTLAGQLSGKDGSPIVGAVQARADQLGHTLVTRFKQARSAAVSLGLIIASDYGKLTTANREIVKGGTWAWPPDDAPIATAIRKGARVWFYSELMPLAWKTFDLSNADNAHEWQCSHDNGSIHRVITYYNTFQREPADGQFRPVLGFGPDMKPDTTHIRALGISTLQISDLGTEHNSAQPPPSSLTDPLFRPLSPEDDSPNLGLTRQQFYQRYFTHVPELLKFRRRCDP